MQYTCLTVCCNSNETEGEKKNCFVIPGAVNIFTSYTCLQIAVFYSKLQITLHCNGIQKDLV